VQAVEDRLMNETARIKVAVMGCSVNGPGEAREADIGLAGGRDRGCIFRKGKIIRSARGQEALLGAFMEELEKVLASTPDNKSKSASKAKFLSDTAERLQPCQK
jgi:(E)-4-hydroxy-3-methylbut-2-enyl-diphosphate synthase